ncbi:MAG TPA: DUF5615 family PIN-like protein [Tepidiformaceae bacterium]|nr:DUF5615 family PIN-like protein [Tepidiformaceae bacterium]
MERDAAAVLFRRRHSRPRPDSVAAGRRSDAVAPYEAGMYGQSDGSHLLHASADGRVLCSANRGDFIQLHGQWMRDGRHHAGIVLINQQQHSIGEQLRRLLRISAEQAAEDMMDRLEFLTAWPAQEA